MCGFDTVTNVVAFCSDEGDTSSSDGSDNELNMFNANEEGLLCCQSVPLVPPPSPVTPTKTRTNKRVNSIQQMFHTTLFYRSVEKFAKFHSKFSVATYKGKINQSAYNGHFEKIQSISSIGH